MNKDFREQLLLVAQGKKFKTNLHIVDIRTLKIDRVKLFIPTKNLIITENKKIFSVEDENISFELTYNFNHALQRANLILGRKLKKLQGKKENHS